jgi:MYXO-CTERM domain-containing protein
MPATLPTNVQAFMTWSATRTTGVAGDVNCGTMCTQAMNGGTLTITSVNPMMSTHGPANTLLQATFTGMVSGGMTGDYFSMAAGNGAVVYSSDFFDFSRSTYSAFNFGFYSVLADLARSGGNFMNILASGNGIFKANNIRPTFSPEPSTFVLGAMALGALAMLRRRNRSTPA